MGMTCWNRMFNNANPFGRQTLLRFICHRWSPTWEFTDKDFDQTAISFNNPDFVDVVIHSYRHRFGLVPGDPLVEETEQNLTKLPKISVPSLLVG